jgi:hypothetical protein
MTTRRGHYCGNAKFPQSIGFRHNKLSDEMLRYFCWRGRARRAKGWGLEHEPTIHLPDHCRPPSPEGLPGAVLYAIAAPVGGHGLGTTAANSLQAARDAGILGGVVAATVDRRVTGHTPVRDLRFHPARLAAFCCPPNGRWNCASG